MEPALADPELPARAAVPLTLRRDARMRRTKGRTEGMGCLIPRRNGTGGVPEIQDRERAKKMAGMIPSDEVDAVRKDRPKATWTELMQTSVDANEDDEDQR